MDGSSCDTHPLLTEFDQLQIYCETSPHLHIRLHFSYNYRFFLWMTENNPPHQHHSHIITIICLWASLTALVLVIIIKSFSVQQFWISLYTVQCTFRHCVWVKYEARRNFQRFLFDNEIDFLKLQLTQNNGHLSYLAVTYHYLTHLT